MPRITITIDTDTDAFDTVHGPSAEVHEVARILGEIVNRIDLDDDLPLASLLDGHVLHDWNGNRVGTATVTADTREVVDTCGTLEDAPAERAATDLRAAGGTFALWQERQRAILRHINDNPTRRFTVKELTAATGLPEHAVRSNLDGLRLKGMIDWTPGAGRIPGVWGAKGVRA